MKQLKGQINLEFMAAAAFYLITLGIVVTASSDLLPHYSDSADRSSLNLEARTLTDAMLSKPGLHDYGDGGSNWEKNSSTVTSATAFGLASDFLEVERDKINALTTVGEDKLNYSRFKQVSGAENQYRFRFTWLPTIQTHQSFTRGDPPTSPPIVEPGNNNQEPYNITDNEIHYGEINLEGNSYKFLVTARDGVYNATYVSSTWDFFSSSPIGQGESFQLYGTPYNVKTFQNRENDPGSMLMLERQINEFGAGIDSNSIVVTMQRFAVMEGEPLKIEVWTW